MRGFEPECGNARARGLMACEDRPTIVLKCNGRNMVLPPRLMPATRQRDQPAWETDRMA